MLVWIDLETTGLDFDKESILEVAAIITNDAFDEVTRFRKVVHFPQARTIVQTLAGARELNEDIEAMYAKVAKRFDLTPYVVRMHDVNGLWKDCVNGEDLGVVDDCLAAFIEEHGQWREESRSKPGEIYVHKPPLAGSTISFDRQMLWGRMPLTLKALHYRNVDVSSFNEVAERHWQTLYASRPNNETKAHRGMADIEESIRVLKHYMKYLVPAVLP